MTIQLKMKTISNDLKYFSQIVDISDRLERNLPGIILNIKVEIN